jgi:hypothetical protein
MTRAKLMICTRFVATDLAGAAWISLSHVGWWLAHEPAMASLIQAEFKKLHYELQRSGDEL